MIVVDANVIASAFTRVDGQVAARKALDRDDDWKVPTLWRVEYLSALRWAILELGATLDAAMGAYEDAGELFGHREVPVAPRRVLEIGSARRTLSVYDAHYLALAHQFDCVVVTEDRKFATAANDPQVVRRVGKGRVLLVDDYLRRTRG